jgi:hypothetical protein
MQNLLTIVVMKFLKDSFDLWIKDKRNILIAFKNYSLSLLLCATIQLKISSNSAYLFNFELLRPLTQCWYQFICWLDARINLIIDIINSIEERKNWINARTNSNRINDIINLIQIKDIFIWLI